MTKVRQVVLLLAVTVASTAGADRAVAVPLPTCGPGHATEVLSWTDVSTGAALPAQVTVGRPLVVRFAPGPPVDPDFTTGDQLSVLVDGRPARRVGDGEFEVVAAAPGTLALTAVWTEVPDGFSSDPGDLPCAVLASRSLTVVAGKPWAFTPRVVRESRGAGDIWARITFVQPRDVCTDLAYGLGTFDVTVRALGYEARVHWADPCNTDLEPAARPAEDVLLLIGELKAPGSELQFVPVNLPRRLRDRAPLPVDVVIQQAGGFPPVTYRVLVRCRTRRAPDGSFVGLLTTVPSVRRIG